MSISDVSITEGDSGIATATFVVSLSFAPNEAVSVQYATADSTANSSDYTSTSGTITFSAGTTTQTIAVEVQGDTLYELDESFEVDLSNAIGALIGDAQGVGTITNNDTAPTLSIGDVTITEGNSGTVAASFTVSLSTVSGAAVAVEYDTANGTASAPEDYTASSGTLTVAAGLTSQTVIVMVKGDTTYEPNETFTVVLSEPIHATLADGEAVGTISNDDVTPTISIDDVAVVEGYSGTTNLTFTVSLSGISSSAVTVQYATADGTASAPSDYTAASGTLTFDAGTTTKTITVVVSGDGTVETDESLYLNLSNASGATILDSQGRGTLLNDDEATNALPVVATLQLVNDTGSSSTDGVTTDPTVKGTVTDDGAVSQLRVELDWNGDGTADGATFTTGQGDFQYRPEGLLAGSVTVRARAGQPGQTPGQYVFGDWRSLAFTLEAQTNNVAPAVSSLSLVHDTGSSASDGITADPTLTGSVTDNGSVVSLLVEFDHNGDDTADGSIRTESDGTFTHLPEGLASGAQAIRARAREWDSGQGAYIYGAWTPVSFTVDSTANSVPVVATLALFRDTLESATDRVTTDPRLTGHVTDDGSLQAILLEFDRDGDGVADGSSYTTSDGHFWYFPQGLATGSLTFQARARETLYGQSEPVYGPWTTLSFTLVDDPNDLAPNVVELAIQNDTGTSPSDGLTGDPRLRGAVTNDGSVFNLRVEFDVNGDDAADGTEYVDTSGHFSFTPVGLADGPVTVRARAVEWNSDRFADRFGTWTALTFVLDYAQNLAPELQQVALKYDTGTFATDLVTRDPTLVGSVTNDGELSGLMIEIDQDGDGWAERSALTDGAGAFVITPQGLAAGEHTIQVRPREWLPGLSAVDGVWTPITFTLDPNANVPPTVGALHLYNDTGSSNTDGVTRDSRLTGTIGDDGALVGLVVEFDQDGDGIPEGIATPGSAGQFRYAPLGLLAGPITVRARAGEVQPDSTVANYSAWLTFSFTLEIASSNAPPTISQLKLFRDTGSSATDGQTSDPRVRGVAANDGAISGLRIEFDVNGDGFAEAHTTTDRDGEFIYVPDVAAGSVTIRARAGEQPGSDSSYAFGPWTTLTFALEGDADNLTPEIFKLKLFRDTGSSGTDRITTDSTLVGTITNDGDVLGLLVEFDHNGDGTPEGSVTTDTAGQFTYEPPNLSVGSVTVRARVKESLPGTGDVVTGDWLSFSFTLESAPPPAPPDPATLPVVNGLELLGDTGSSATDRVTTDPAVTGVVTNLVLAGPVLVQFDQNQDGTPDASVEPDGWDEFLYLGEGLAAGNITLKARAGVCQSTTATCSAPTDYSFGAWASLVFTLQSDASNTAPSVASLALVHDTGASSTDGITSDVTLSGSVTDNGRVGSLLVEFDVNGDSTPDGSVRTDADGRFRYVPAGLALGAQTVRARAREWDPGQNAFVYGAWTTLNFVLDATADLAPAVGSIQLFKDTGASSTDGITSDPTLTGSITDDGNRSGIRVDFDHDGDGVADGWSITADGQFWYVPPGLTAGSKTIQVRAAQCRADQQPCISDEDYLYSPWSPFSFTLEFPPNVPAAVATFGLEYDTGSSSNDAVTSDSRLVGSVSNDGDEFGLRVEVDHDGDGVLDGIAFTDSDGDFKYRPIGLVDGPVTIRARVREWDLATAAFITSDWSSFSFTLDPAANLAPTIASVALLFDTGASSTDKVTRDPRLTGVITNDGNVANLRVEFDHNGDGSPDGSKLTDVSGEFLYAPAGLPEGPVTIRARVRDGETETASPLSDWSSFTFTLNPAEDVAPSVISLVLARDTGSSSSDGITTDATLKGQVSDDGSLLHATVEFDHNGDGTVDGTTITDAQGKFNYVPQGLSLGALTIRARAKTRAFGSSEFSVGDWTALAFTLETGAPGGVDDKPASATAAFELAVSSTVEAYNTNAPGSTNTTAFQLQNASYTPLQSEDAAGSGASGGSGSSGPVTSTSFQVKTAPAVPANSEHTETVNVTTTGNNSSGSYTSTSTVSITSTTTSSGSATSGTWSESVNVCDTYNHSETGSSSSSDTSNGVTTVSSMSYILTASGSYCFGYTASGSYSVGTDGMVTISGSYTISETASGGYTYWQTSSTAVVMPMGSFTASGVLNSSGNASFTYGEYGTYSAGPSTSSFSGQYSLSANADGSSDYTELGNYAISMTMPMGGSSSASGNYLLTLSGQGSVTISGLGGLSVNGSSIYFTPSGSVNSSGNSTFGYIETGSYSSSSGSSSSSGNFVLTMSSFASGSSFGSATLLITDTSGSGTVTFSANSTAMAGYSYTEGGSFSSPTSSGNYTLSASANVSASSGVAGNLLITSSSLSSTSFSLTGNFYASASANGTVSYKGSGSTNYGGTSVNYSNSSGATGSFSTLVAGGFAITESNFAVAGFFATSANGQSQFSSKEIGTITGAGTSSNFTRNMNGNDSFSSGSTGGFFVSSGGSGGAGVFNQSQSHQFSTSYVKNGTTPSSKFNRSDSSLAESSSLNSGKFMSSGSSTTVIGQFESDYLNKSDSAFIEEGTYFGTTNFKIETAVSHSSDGSDSGNYTISNTSTSVTGKFAQSDSHSNSSKSKQDFGSLSSFMVVIEDENSNKSTSSVSGDYSLTNTTSSRKGDFDQSQKSNYSHTLTGGGSYATGNCPATYTMNNGNSGESSTTDTGTFSASTSAGSSTSTVTGVATQFNRATNSSSRNDSGTCSGSTSSSFKHGYSEGSYDVHSTTSNYTVTDGSRTADGPYSSSRTHNSNNYSQESGTRAGGVTFSSFNSASTNSLYSDSGNFSESPTTWSRKGEYTDISGSSSSLNITETSTISGGAETGTSTRILESSSQSGSTDTGTYSKSASGTSVDGTYDSSSSSHWHDRTDRTGSYNDGTTSYDFVSHGGGETRSSDNDAGTHSQGFNMFSRIGERTQSSFSESKNSGSQTNGARTGTTTSTFSKSSDHTVTKESETTTPYTITDAGSSSKSYYDVSELDESNYNSSENGSFNDGTKSGTFSESSSGGTNNGLSDVGLVSSDGTGNGLYHMWRSSNGTSTSERTEIQGTITTKTKNTDDSSFDYDDSNIYTLSKGQRTGSGTIELTTRSHMKVTQDTTGTYSMGSVTCTIDDRKLHEQTDEWKQQATYTFTGPQVQMNPSTGTRQHDEDQTHTWLYCINGSSYPMADTPINSHDGPQSIDGYPIGQQQPQSGGGGGSPGGGVAGRGSGGAGKAQPRDCDGFWDCLVHPDWDLYWHYLKNGNDNPVDWFDHVLNVAEGAAIGVAGTAAAAAIALTFPVTAPFIFYGGIIMTGIGVGDYIIHFGELSTGDHERFWGGVIGSLATGMFIYFKAPLYHYTTAEGAAGIKGDGMIRAPVWSTNIPPEIMMHPIAGPFFKVWIGWFGPYKTGPIGYYPLTDWFPVPTGWPWLKPFQFWTDNPVIIRN